VFSVSARTPGSLGFDAPGITIPLGLGQPGAQGLDLSVKLARVDSELNALVLNLCELLAQLVVLDGHG